MLVADTREQLRAVAVDLVGEPQWARRAVVWRAPRRGASCARTAARPRRSSPSRYSASKTHSCSSSRRFCSSVCCSSEKSERPLGSVTMSSPSSQAPLQSERRQRVDDRGPPSSSSRGRCAKCSARRRRRAAEQADAVVLELVNPAVVAGHFVDERRELRLQRRGQGLAARALRFRLRGLGARLAAPPRAFRCGTWCFSSIGGALDSPPVAGVDGVRVGAGTCRGVTGFHQQPLRLFALHARAHQVPTSGELAAGQLELEVALLQSLGEIADRLPGAVVPDVDVPAAVLALRNVTFEFRVRDRVVFHFHREALVRRIERRSLRHGPAAQRAFPLEPEVPVQAARRVLLHDEDELFAARGACFVARLGGFAEIALRDVALETRVAFRPVARVRHASGAARAPRIRGAASRGAVFALAGARRGAGVLGRAPPFWSRLRCSSDMRSTTLPPPVARSVDFGFGLGQRVGLARLDLLLDALHEIVAIGVGERLRASKARSSPRRA